MSQQWGLSHRWLYALYVTFHRSVKKQQKKKKEQKKIKQNAHDRNRYIGSWMFWYSIFINGYVIYQQSKSNDTPGGCLITRSLTVATKV